MYSTVFAVIFTFSAAYTYKVQTLNTLPLSSYANFTHDCACGAQHKIKTKHIVFGSSVLDYTIDIILQYAPYGSHVLVLSDALTNAVIAGDIIEKLQKKGVKVEHSVLDCGFTPSVTIANGIFVSDYCKLIIGVGGGAICDTAKFLSAVYNIQTYLYATNCATTSYLTESALIKDNGFFQLFKTPAPIGITACTDSLITSNNQAVINGLGSIASRGLSLFDYKLSNLLYNTPFCDTVYEQVFANIYHTLDTLSTLKSGDANVAPLLLESCVKISALTQCTNNSQLICGSEALVAQSLMLANNSMNYGQLEFYSACALSKFFYKAIDDICNFSVKNFIAPPNNVKRIDKIASFFNIPITKSYYKIHPQINSNTITAYQYAVNTHSTQLKQLLEQISQILARANKILTAFLNSDPTITKPVISANTFGTCLALAPDLREKQTFLTAIKQLGLLDSFI